MTSFIILLVALLSPSLSSARCYEPSPAFPPPDWKHDRTSLNIGLDKIETLLQPLLERDGFDTSSVSIELTSASETIWSRFHSPRTFDKKRPGTNHVDAKSIYRIASTTKAFTVLALLYQHQAGNVSLDDSIHKYLPELSGELPWKDITLRMLASQSSGIPREFAQDIVYYVPDPSNLGLPLASLEGLPDCNAYSNYSKPCDKLDLSRRVNDLKPVFAPNSRASYNNIAFSLLGLVIEKVTGLSYAEYMTEAIFKPLNMSSTTLSPPASDDHAVLPANQSWYWDVDEGVEAPTGGIYSSSEDLSKFLRYVLTHYNSIATGINWLLPVNWAETLGSFYGMPWEIFQTQAILTESRRAVRFVTKSGGMPGYYTKIYILEEYGFGLTILTSGEDSSLLELVEDIVVPNIVRAAEEQAWEEIDGTYTGRYEDIRSDVNSSVELASSPRSGLVLTSFVSNGTDVYRTFLPLLADAMIGKGIPWRAQLTPTLLYRNQTTQEGEIWYVVMVPDERPAKPHVFEEFCRPAIDPIFYAGQAVTQVIFWHNEGIMELPAWNVSVRRSQSRAEKPVFFIQG